VPEVRLIGANGDQLGVVSTYDAMTQARSAGLDLVEISPTARPPVCRIMDYGKYRYDLSKKEKQNKRSATATKVKEIQLHPSVGDHDYEVKLRHLKDFLGEGHRVKVALFFRGRENAHKELGFELMNRVLADVREIGVVEQAPKLLGRNIQMVLPEPEGSAGDQGGAGELKIGGGGARFCWTGRGKSRTSRRLF
jgi:translation initiation factor IF-3